ncbi:IucA/IucC family protein [Caldalkalibacillus salinus]|uniref:IucA/IucC family protein n=1 Tax=Caldalkalibacillus salinus TaxID=2803787 RepID=UPI0019245109|nr:IucA/IucC family protein [Caldalkalibacillus salinus]
MPTVEQHEELNHTEQYLQTHHPHMVPYFQEAIEEAQKKVLYKFAAAVLREDLNGLYTNAITVRKNNADGVVDQAEPNHMIEKPKHVLTQLEALGLRENVTYFVCDCEGGRLVFPVQTTYAYRRFVLSDDVLHITEEGCHKIKTAGELLTYLQTLTTPSAAQLYEELCNATANLALAIAEFHAECASIQAGRRPLSTGIQTALDYALAQSVEDPTWSKTTFFEQLCVEGHQLHPCAKTKTKLSPGDVLRYSPEFHQPFSIRFVALRKDYLLSHELQLNGLADAFPEIENRYHLLMREKGYDPTSYQWLPVHEWQYKHALQDIYTEELREDILVPLDELQLEGRATSSFRTLVPIGVGTPSLKLAVNSQMTSTVRSISTQTAMNAVPFTRLISDILAHESHLDTFKPIYEVAGYSFRSEREDQSRNLSVVLRENVDKQLADDQLAIVGCSLYSLSPVSGKPIIAELLDTYCAHLQRERHEGLISFFNEYLSHLLPGVLTLLTKYGIALEGHLQNSVPVFRQGQPVGLYFRDWGGARIYIPRLKRQGYDADFYSDSVTVTYNRDEMWDKAYYTVFQNHIGELIVQLCEYTGVAEDVLWEIVRARCDQCFQALIREGYEQAKDDAARLYEPMVKHKALTTMRLKPDEGYCYTQVLNPLHQVERTL